MNIFGLSNSQETFSCDESEMKFPVANQSEKGSDRNQSEDEHFNFQEKDEQTIYRLLNIF